MEIKQLKVVINFKENKATVGLQSPDCDPVLNTVEGELQVVLQQLPELIQKAQEQWSQSARYPKTSRPELPALAPQPAATASKSAAAASEKKGPQSSLF